MKDNRKNPAPPTRPRVCGTCELWMDYGETDRGECHRYAPRPVVTALPCENAGGQGNEFDARPTLGVAVDWPEANEWEFCGEWVASTEPDD